jgi:hypothetical protein
MMKNYLFIALLLLIISACSDNDEKSTKNQLKVATKEYAVDNLFIYYDYTENYNNYSYNKYYVTNIAIATEPNENQEYFSFEIILGATDDLKIEAGAFPQYYNDYELTSSKFSYNGDELETIDNLYNGTPIHVKGGFSIGENITMKFNGSVDYYNGESDQYEEKNISFTFSGKILPLPYGDTRMATTSFISN